MKLTIEKTVTEEIEIAVPCYRKHVDNFYHVTDTSVLQVRDSLITLWKKFGEYDVSFKSRVQSAFSGIEITEAEFDQKYNEVIASFRNANKLTVAV